MTAQPFDSIADALQALKRGEPVIVVDDEDWENEGDFIVNAETVTPETINFLAIHGRGLICVAMTARDTARLELPPMVRQNTASLGTNFTVSVDAAEGTSTGISAADRARTVRLLASLDTKPGDFSRPGHIFPLQASDEGVLSRAGHTEAAVDLARLSGAASHSGVLCEIMSADGTMARLPELRQIAKTHDLRLISIADLIAYRRRHEGGVARSVEVDFPTRFGRFKLVLYEGTGDGREHLALVKGDPASAETALVRVHSECLTGDALGSLRCDCGDQLGAAMEQIGQARCGVLLYMRQEGRGIGLANKLLAYRLQEEGHDTVEANTALGFGADLRDYGVGAQILRDLGIRKLRLLTNNPRKVSGLADYDFEIVERVPLQIAPTAFNARYLATKRAKLGHILGELQPEESV